MSFLTPLLLVGLPLAALPILIHLVNQRRFQTMQWAAMRFLLEANRMSRGLARIRQWLILLLRAGAIAALVFAISRPLAGGWLGLTGSGSVDATLILIDRSPSMSQLGRGGAQSKIETGVRQLARLLAQRRSNRWVLIDSVALEPRELEGPASLVDSAHCEATSAASDLPALLQAAHDYIRANHIGETEIWICSDLRANDWDARSGRWQSLRESFLKFEQNVRIRLLAYADPGAGNVSIRVTNVRREEDRDAAGLRVSFELARAGRGTGMMTLPVTFEIEGARSQTKVTFEGTEFELNDFAIALHGDRKTGWGRVSIPADANGADNDYFFVFDEPPTRTTVIVSDDPSPMHPVQLAARISRAGTDRSTARIVSRQQVASVDWEQTALVVWHAPLPEGAAADQLRALAQRGCPIVFFPPEAPGTAELFGVRWGNWIESEKAVAVDRWRGDHDLLARTQSGAALPVGELQIRRYCRLEGDATPIAALRGGAVLVGRAPAQGPVYFVTTTPTDDDSSLAVDGVTFYAAIQRALDLGTAQLGAARQATAGETIPGLGPGWLQVAGDADVLSTEYRVHRGVYGGDGKMIAVNRPVAEEGAAVLESDRAAALFEGLDFAQVNDEAGSVAALMREIGRLFLCAMLVALVLESALSMPPTSSAREDLA